MAMTETKSGFRPPWSSDRSQPNDRADRPRIGADPEPGRTDDPTVPAATDHVLGWDVTSPDQESETHPMIETAPSPMGPAPRKTNRLMADLASAMQVAAEAARTDTLARLSQDVKAHIEAVHAQAATDATDLRKQADDDVVAIRDRSKAEISRIRDETEGRITQRKLALDGEIEDYNAAVEHRIEAVQARVATFELEMAEFFAALLAETDPTRVAGMAEALPEPPIFDQHHPNDEVVGSLDVVEPVETPEPTQATDLHGPEATFDHAAETDPTIDPRLAALGLASHFAAAEAAAAESSVEENDPSDQNDATRIVVVGLVSVVTIAGFKRQLARVAGVQSVGVSSGPEGEFVFAVQHAPQVNLRDAIPALQHFAARVTTVTDGDLQVIARDPETEV